MPLNPGRRLGQERRDRVDLVVVAAAREGQQLARNVSSQGACTSRSTCPASNFAVCAAIDPGGSAENNLEDYKVIKQ